MKRLVFDLTKIRFLEHLFSISCLIVEVLDDQNLFTESNLADLFSSYFQFCSGGHFSERAEAELKCGKMNRVNKPGDFVTKVKQISSQSDLIWTRSFAGPSYLTIRSSLPT